MISKSTFDQTPPDRTSVATILIVDDSELSRKTHELLCTKLNDSASLRILLCSHPKEALRILDTTTVHVVLLDVNFEEEGREADGIEAIPELLGVQPDLQILMLTGSNEIQNVVKAMNYGAFGYVEKRKNNDLIIAQINRALKVARLSMAKTSADRQLRGKDELELVGSSVAIKRLRAQIPVVAESSRPVLLTGPSGAGKTTVARIIHEERKKYLKQHDRSFYALNMGAIAPTIAERELFGNDEGAFTGARKDKQGFFELANNGTLFLDEIGEASLDLQVKLLKVLDEGKFFRVGGTKEIRSSFKLICATNRDLEQMIAEKKFREDLYMRISTLTIRIPTLEERKEDIPEIIKSLIPRCCEDAGIWIDYNDLPKDFIAYATETPLRGNIRGIEQLLSRLLSLSPRDKTRKPIFKNWKTNPKLEIQGMGANSGIQKNELSLDDILNLPTNIIGPGFPGLETVIQSVTERIFSEARQKYPQNKEVAKVLKVSESLVSLRLRQIGADKYKRRYKIPRTERVHR